MMKNYDQSIEINHISNWSFISDHHRTLIIGGSGSGKTNVLLNLIKHQRPDFGKIYLSVKDTFESKYELLFWNLKNWKEFIDYWQIIDYIYETWKTIIQERKGKC